MIKEFVESKFLLPVFMILILNVLHLFHFSLYSKPQHTVQLYTDVDPSFRLIQQDKEQAIMALQETVEVHRHNIHTLLSPGNTCD